nr:hypothetical protein HmN_001012000 [Hymenolepis microstoma]
MLSYVKHPEFGLYRFNWSSSIQPLVYPKVLLPSKVPKAKELKFLGDIIGPQDTLSPCAESLRVRGWEQEAEPNQKTLRHKSRDESP